MPIVKCDYCGKDVHKKPSRLKRSKYLFCSTKCHYAAGSFVRLRTHKICADCKNDKPVSEYYAHRGTVGDQLSSYCKKCDIKRSNNFRKNHKEQSKGYWKEYYRKNRDIVKQQCRLSGYKRTYGITIEQRDEIIKKQHGVCAICKIELATDTDHNHVTGRVRGILCHYCNAGLGFFRDNPLIILSAAQYIENDAN